MSGKLRRCRTLDSDATPCTQADSAPQSQSNTALDRPRPLCGTRFVPRFVPRLAVLVALLMLAVPAIAAETLGEGETRKAMRAVVEGDVAGLLGTATQSAKVRVWNCRGGSTRGPPTGRPCPAHPCRGGARTQSGGHPGLVRGSGPTLRTAGLSKPLHR